MTAIVEVRDLKKQYDPPNGVVAVKGVSFEINRGEIFSLLGPNGAGKTTIISMMSSLLTPTAGDVIIGGHSVLKEVAEVKKLIGVVPQELALYNSLTARENLDFWGKMYDLKGPVLKERIGEVLDVVSLSDRADDKVETFSTGMKRRLNIAVGLLHEPQLLFLDEPTVGIDPQSRRRILDNIKELNEAGLTVLYTTHYLEEAEELSHRIGIIDHGELIAIDTLDALTKMIAQYDTIRLEVGAAAGRSNGELPLELAAIPGVRKVHKEDQQIILQVQNVNQELPLVLKHITNNGSDVRQLIIQKPNLEAVFLHLTGRALRD